MIPGLELGDVEIPFQPKPLHDVWIFFASMIIVS